MLHARHALGQFEPVGERILAEIRREFVDEALDRKRVVAVADAAPRRQPGAAILDHMFGELVGNRVLRDRRALHDDTILPRARIARRIGHDRLGDDAVVPGDELVVGIEAGFDVMRCHRPELADWTSSSRVQMNFTGLRTAFESRTASNTASWLPRRP